MVQSKNEEVFDGNNPALCPGPTQDNPVTALTLTEDAGALVASWQPTTDAWTTSIQVYGFRVSLFKEDADTQEYEPVVGWLGRLFRTYDPADGANPAFGLAYASGTYIMTVNTAGPVVIYAAGEKYKVEVTTYNLNGEVSSTVAAESNPR